MSRGSIFLSPVFVSPANNEAISAATASSTRLVVSRCDPETQRLIPSAANRKRLRVGFSRCCYRRKINAFNDKRIAAPAENRVYSIEELRFRTPIPAQGVTAIRNFCRFQISKNVRAAKSIDCLFGIADKKYGSVATAINLREDRILHRIGILELIHQRDGETLEQTFSQLVPPLAPQCFVQSREHVIKRLNAPIRLPPAQFLTRPFTKFRLQRDDETFRQFCDFHGITPGAAQFGNFLFQSGA